MYRTLPYPNLPHPSLTHSDKWDLEQQTDTTDKWADTDLMH